MYINVAWFPLNGTSPVDIEGEILGLLTHPDLRFTDVYTPWDGFFIASIKKGNSRQEIQLLHDELRKTAGNRFSYVVTVTPNSWDLCRSADQTDPIYAKIVAYQT
jgi:hypothetical protein